MANLIQQKRQQLKALIGPVLANLCDELSQCLDCASSMDALLRERLHGLPGCSLLYVVSPEGRQLSANVSATGVDETRRDQDLSERPYLSGSQPFRGLVLSQAYMSRPAGKPALTAVHAVNRDGSLLGFLAADFYLEDIPLAATPLDPDPQHIQFKGDVAIRQSLFDQTRVESPMDRQLDQVLEIVELLMTEHGIFHSMIHFSSSRAVLWHIDDPYDYKLHGLDELTDLGICLAYPKSQMLQIRSKVSPAQLAHTLRYFRALRLEDENIYLRMGSLNVLNARVGLTFSCDGTHYLKVQELLDRNLAFWFGGAQQAV